MTFKIPIIDRIRYLRNYVYNEANNIMMNQKMIHELIIEMRLCSKHKRNDIEAEKKIMGMYIITDNTIIYGEFKFLKDVVVPIKDRKPIEKGSLYDFYT